MVSVAKDDPTYRNIADIREIPIYLPIESEHFLTSNTLVKNKHVQSFGEGKTAVAVEAVRYGYEQKNR